MSTATGTDNVDLAAARDHGIGGPSAQLGPRVQCPRGGPGIPHPRPEEPTLEDGVDQQKAVYAGWASKSGAYPK